MISFRSVGRCWFGLVVLSASLRCGSGGSHGGGRDGGTGGGGGGGGGQASGITVTLAPKTAQTTLGHTVQFQATVAGADDTSVAWAVEEGAPGGSVSASGLYTAPTQTGTFHVVATSHADGAAAGRATVVVVGAPGNCASLPKPNTWESIVPSGVTWSDAIVVDPFDPAVLWLGTKGTGLFKSKDCGANWTHVSTGIDGALMESGEMVSMAVDPTTPGVLYTTSWNGAEGVWKSTNGGVDWKQIFPTPDLVDAVSVNSEMSSVAMEAGNPQHLIVSAHAPCNPPYGPICLAETDDGGETWRIVTVPAPSGASNVNWTNYMPGAGAFILDAKTWLFSSYTDGLWLTVDDGMSWKNVTAQGAFGATGGKTLNHPFVPSAEGTYYLVSQQGMTKSQDGLSWSLIPNSGGSGVGFAMGGGHLYAADQWSLSYNSASAADDGTWSAMTPPAAPQYQTFPQGGVYLAYDEAHHILYSSNWFGGVWRMVTQ